MTEIVRRHFEPEESSSDKQAVSDSIQKQIQLTKSQIKLAFNYNYIHCNANCYCHHSLFLAISALGDRKKDGNRLK
jgi:hypothetical protein